MTLEKLPDLPSTPWRQPLGPCLNPEHNPPTMIVLAPGRYRHTCPGCGAQQEFFVFGTVC